MEMVKSTNQNNEPILKTEKDGHILIMTLNRPEALNAINADMTLALESCLKEAEKDPDIWVMIITGTGRAFSAGADLKEMSQGRKQVQNEWGFAGITRAKLSKPVIAAVNGLAYGGGCEIALACDIIIASETASFALPEVKRGIMAAAGGLLRMPRQIPLKIAMEMIMTGEPVTAADMARWGLVNRVVAPEKLMAEAKALAEKICGNAPLAVRASKRVVLESLDQPLTLTDEAWQTNDKVVAEIRTTEDAKEGPLAFSQKRKPEWKGR